MRPKEQIISDIFLSLKDQQVNFVVLRNFENIPNNCTIENDIDILINNESMAISYKVFKEYGFEKEEDKDIYFYNTKPHQHFYLYTKGIHFDVVSGLYYRSINDVKQWVPLHQRLQEQIFENKIFVENVPWFYAPSDLDQLLHLICHCIFDKRTVKSDYKIKIETLYSKLSKSEIFQSLKLIFFQFTSDLIDIIENKKTELLYERYITFRGY